LPDGGPKPGLSLKGVSSARNAGTWLADDHIPSLACWSMAATCGLSFTSLMGRYAANTASCVARNES
jgi:hypothetical protein